MSAFSCNCTFPNIHGGMADIQRPHIDILIQELQNDNDIWREIRSKLKITDDERLNPEQLKKEGGHKPACTTFKLTATKSDLRGNPYHESWVVKFSPKDKQDDPWYDVYKEYETLKELDSFAKDFPAPKPLHRCSEAERRVVGSKFIIMSFVEGKSYKNAKAIPPMEREKAFSSVMSVLAKKVHRNRYHWPYVTIYSNSRIYRQYSDTQCFWHDEVYTWKRNYDTATADGPECRNDEVDNFFDEMTKKMPPPSDKFPSVIHGDMTISKIIFDEEYNVKAFVDWKTHVNGDPMVDVAYLCLTFMTPGDYGEEFPALNDHPLLLEKDSIETKVILGEYKKHAALDEKAFNYAKAVCCLRWISILKVAQRNDFKGHKSGTHEHHTKRTQEVMTCLAKAGKIFLKPQDSCTIT